MKRIHSFLLAVALMLVGFANAATFDFTYSSDANNAFGTIEANDLGNGTFLATSGVLNVTSGEMVGTFSLLPGGPDSFYSPTGTFIVDNVVTPTEPSVFTYGGVLFGSAAGEINIYSVAPGQFKFDYFNGSYNTIEQVTGTVALTAAVPEPSTYALIGAGALALLVLSRRKA